MERPVRNEKDDAQKAKLIFLSVAALVTILLIVSFVYAGKARSARDVAVKEAEALKQDNVKLSQWLEERTQEVEALRKQIEKCQAKPKAKAAKSKSTSKSASKKKSSKTTKGK